MHSNIQGCCPNEINITLYCSSPASLQSNYGETCFYVGMLASYFTYKNKAHLGKYRGEKAIIPQYLVKLDTYLPK